MFPRKQTDWIVVTATMTDERLPAREIEWRGRKYGYLDAGCHFIIENEITTVVRPRHMVGVGVRPHNDRSVVITLSGKPPFTASQLEMLGATVDGMLGYYPTARVVAHSALPGSRSDAPGFDVDAWFVGHKAAKAVSE